MRRISAIFEEYCRYNQSYLVEYEIDKYNVVSTQQQIWHLVLPIPSLLGKLQLGKEIVEFNQNMPICFTGRR